MEKDRKTGKPGETRTVPELPELTNYRITSEEKNIESTKPGNSNSYNDLYNCLREFNK